MQYWDSVAVDDVENAGRWDAEFYVNPYKEFLEDAFSRWSDWTSLKDASTRLTSGHTPLRHDVSVGDTPFVTVECIDPLTINLSKAKRVWKTAAQTELARVQVRRGDVLITIKRRIGISCPIDFDPELMVINQDVVVMTPKPKFRPGYLAALLVSRIGQYQALRNATEQMNPYISVSTLGRLMIPDVADSIQEEIELAVFKRSRSTVRSVQRYRDAETELLERFNWKRLASKQRELSYTRGLDELFKANRSDAEFFHPFCTRLANALDSKGSLSVGDVCGLPRRGVQPEFRGDGKVIVVDSKAVRPLGIDPNKVEHTSTAFFNLPSTRRARIEYSDVLLNSTGRGTLGRAACYLLKTNAIADNHVSILRPNRELCDPVYLSLFLNSPLGIAQSERFQAGSSGQLEIYPEHIGQFRIFLPKNSDGSPDLGWQKKLALMVVEAIDAKAQAEVEFTQVIRKTESVLGF